jgi:nucleotide-binding universal stress UspA family protein
VAIFLAVDGSEPALAAARKAVEVARRFRETPRIELATVHLPVPKVGGVTNLVSQEMLDRYYREEGEAALGGARAILDESGVDYTAHVFVGKPAHTIVEEAQRLACEVIFMGTRGLSTVASVLVGSCAMKVLHLARVPVVLVR